jgi:hypothetical protein
VASWKVFLSPWCRQGDGVGSLMGGRMIEGGLRVVCSVIDGRKVRSCPAQHQPLVAAATEQVDESTRIGPVG